MHRIWFNHWFSTAYNIISLVRAGVPDVHIIGSHADDSPIRLVCDEWYEDSSLHGEEYVDWCLDFCSKHEIEVFVPHREALEISRWKEDFEQRGTKVMVDDSGAMELLSDKERTYAFCAKEKLGEIPDYIVVHTPDEFEIAYKELSEKHERVCCKFLHDSGGRSFRLIDNTPRGFEALYRLQSTTRISFDALLSALRERNSFPGLMVMQYLPDEEYSIDCVNSDGEFILILRIKDHSRLERTAHRPDLIDISAKIGQKLVLRNPYNVQFKCSGGVSYFLEVNPRMSGGIYLSSAASGINLPALAVCETLGLPRPDFSTGHRRDCTIGQVLTPVILTVS